MVSYATGAKLLNYPDEAGPAGSRLVPEVAASLPHRSADGRTYTFKIRWIPLLAAIERTPHSPNLQVLDRARPQPEDPRAGTFGRAVLRDLPQPENDRPKAEPELSRPTAASAARDPDRHRRRAAPRPEGHRGGCCRLCIAIRFGQRRVPACASLRARERVGPGGPAAILRQPLARPRLSHDEHEPRPLLVGDDEESRQLRDRQASARTCRCKRRRGRDAHRPVPPAGHARLQGRAGLSVAPERRQG
jgi:hypothetical protein